MKFLKEGQRVPVTAKSGVDNPAANKEEGSTDEIVEQSHSINEGQIDDHIEGADETIIQPDATYLGPKEFLPHELRIAIIYENKVHGTSIRQMSKTSGRSFSTLYNVIRVFNKHGYTNRMRNHKEKIHLLKVNQRRQHDKINRVLDKLAKKWLKETLRSKNGGSHQMPSASPI